MSLYWTNRNGPQKLPLIGITIERWKDSEYWVDLPGYHIRIEWKRGKWWGSDYLDEESWVRRGRPMCYRHIICFEFNWPRIWWR